MDTTNYYTVTNMVFLVSTNPVPVTLAGLDYQTVFSLYYDGIMNGVPTAVLVTVCLMIYRALKIPHFPSGEN